MAGSPPNLHTMVSRLVCAEDMLNLKVDVKLHVIWALIWIHKNCFFSQANGCILAKLSLSITSLPFVRSVFFRIPIPKWLSVCAVSSAISHTVKQFVKLFAIQYSLTFCLYMRSLYEAPLQSPSSISIKQLGLMSKSWNELLRHWRSSCYIYTGFKVHNGPYCLLYWHNISWRYKKASCCRDIVHHAFCRWSIYTHG